MKNRLFTSLVIIIIIFMCSFIIGGCKTVKEETTAAENETTSGIVLISVKGVYEIVQNNKNYIIIDVRTQEEYDEGHIANVMLIPVDELEDRLDEIPEGKPIIVYCKAGVRSDTAANILLDNGFTQVYDMCGGILEWIDKGYPVIVTGSNETADNSYNNSDVMSVSVDDSYEFYKSGDYIFIDVRSQGEYDSGHIKGATHIPVLEIELRLNDLLKDKAIVVYCNGSGCERSGRVAIILVNNGFTQVYNMAGLGVIEWEEKGYPIE